MNSCHRSSGHGWFHPSGYIEPRRRPTLKPNSLHSKIFLILLMTSSRKSPTTSLSHNNQHQITTNHTMRPPFPSKEERKMVKGLKGRLAITNRTSHTPVCRGPLGKQRMREIKPLRSRGPRTWKSRRHNNGPPGSRPPAISFRYPTPTAISRSNKRIPECE